MATTTDIREWAKGQGLEVKDKGPVPDDVRGAYDAAHDDPAAELGPEADAAAPVITAPPPPAAPPPPSSDPKQAEQRPARPPRAAPAAGGRIAGWIRGTGKPKTRTHKKRAPRISIAGLVEDAWQQMAWAASPLPPMQRLLQAQSVYAGIALDDALAGTFVDTALQPVARAEDKAKLVGGLMFPPMALMLVLVTAPQPQIVADPSADGGEAYVFPEPTMQHKAALMTLRWSFMLMAEAGAAKLDEYSARAEATAERGRQADQFMGWILGGGPEAPGDAAADAVSAEAEAIARAQAMFGGGNGQAPGGGPGI